MRRPRSGIGAELVPLVLILAGLAGSLALIVAVHRKATSPEASKAPAVVVLTTSPPAPKPAPIPEPEEPEPPAPPPPEDPTPKAIAKLTSAEAEQLLEASRADRRAAALEEARKAAQLESEKWRRRESLVRLQLDSLDSKVKKLETDVDELALERDALEKELDARKAMASKARSRPGTAILPHRGQNGTWRRPIVIECSNGTATVQPQGISFGLLELASGFGPATNPFVATVAREAIRIQGSHSPDGQTVIPYIFFLVRPDGIRAYYEARGRLEPLGITFGYELADQDWEIDFPDLDDVKTWDGSPQTHGDAPDAFAKKPTRPPGGSPAEDDEFPTWEAARRSGSSPPVGAPADGFSWPPGPRAPQARGSAPAPGLEPMRGAPSPRAGGLRYSNSSDNRGPGTSDMPVGTDPGGGPPSGPSGVGIGPGTGMGPGAGDPPTSAAPRELSLGSGPITPLAPTNPSPYGRPSGPSGVGALPPSTDPALPGSSLPPGDPSASSKAPAASDPANTFVWPSNPGPGAGGKPDNRPSLPNFDSSDSVDRSSPIRHVGPFSRPLAMGLDSVPRPGAPNPPLPLIEVDPTQPDGASSDATQGGATGNASSPRGTTGSPSNVKGIGQGGAPGVQPPAGSIGVGMPGMPTDGTPPPPGMTPPSGQPKQSTSPSLPELPTPSIIDRRFEIVLVCGPKGVIVQPGSYRVTTDALKHRDGLLKKQIVALVKAKRTADPRITIEPRVRFLVQPGGDQNYWTARSQFLLSGLDWPMTTQVSEVDHVSYMPSESW